MAAQSKLTIDVEANLKLRVGDQQVDLRELAEALTRAGVELQALVDPRQRTVEETTYTSEVPRIVAVE